MPDDDEMFPSKPVETQPVTTETPVAEETNTQGAPVLNPTQHGCGKGWYGRSFKATNRG